MNVSPLSVMKCVHVHVSPAVTFINDIITVMWGSDCGREGYTFSALTN